MRLFHLHDPAVSSHKGQFAWGAHLGSGTFGEVSRCHWKTHNPPVDVAIKVIPKALVASKDDQVHIMNLMKELHHPHVINLIDWFQSREHYYIIFELAEGGELFDRLIDAGHFPEEATSIMIRDIAQGISYCHAHDVVHRDLKPENFLLRGKHDEPPFDVIIADFGVAHEMSHPDEVLRAVAGSPGYTSPEVYAKKGYGKPADMWSLGVIAFVCLAGRFPFKHLEGSAFLDEVAREDEAEGVYFPHATWDKISADAKDFVRRCLASDPKKRITVDDALQHPWLVNAPENPNAVTPTPIKPIVPGKNRATPPGSNSPVSATPTSTSSSTKSSDHHLHGLSAIFSHLGRRSPSASPSRSRDRSPPPEPASRRGSAAEGVDGKLSPTTSATAGPESVGAAPTKAPDGAADPVVPSLRRSSTVCEQGKRTGV